MAAPAVAAEAAAVCVVAGMAGLAVARQRDVRSARNRIAVARAAMEAREFKRARRALEPLTAERPTMRVCLLMADLEQAIADKCRAVLGPHKSVVTEAEVADILSSQRPGEWLGQALVHRARPCCAVGPAPSRAARAPSAVIIAPATTSAAYSPTE